MSSFPDFSSEEVEDFAGPLVLGDARGRRPRGHSTLQVVRELTDEDVPSLMELTKAPPITLHKMRSAHHQLAQLLARGLELTEVSLITGYNIAYICRLHSEDPTFKELVSYYASFEEETFIDIRKRMNTLGLTAVELLQERLTEDPDAFSSRELLEIEKTNLVDTVQKASGGSYPGTSGGGGGSGVNIQVNFVQSENSPKLIDVKANQEK